MSMHVDRTLELPDTEYFAEPSPKSGIALHHTVSDAAHAAVGWWRGDRTPSGNARRVATAYMIDVDGTVFELFDPACWAFHLGVKWPDAERLACEKRFIGIEIVSEGGLIEHDGDLYAYDVVAPFFQKPVEEAFECPALYRGYWWFDRYQPEQLEALGRLVDELCARFSIPRVYPEQPFVYYGQALASFNGVIGHANVRLDKSDPAPDPDLWRALERLARLEPVAIPGSAPRLATPFTAEELDALYERNARRIDGLDEAAGSLVKHLLKELERRDTHVELETPDPDAHDVGYELIHGDPEALKRIARALGFDRVTDTELEVRDA
ncbi:MAG TPA: N-acetylmuramoyl-L-alanine amidase [Gemmatimonadales bacterium]|jgi:hypothetical protein